MLKYIIFILLFFYTFLVNRLLGFQENDFFIVGVFFIALANFKYFFNGAIIFIALFSITLSPSYIYGPITRDYIMSVLSADKLHVFEFLFTLPADLYYFILLLMATSYFLIKYRLAIIINSHYSITLALISIIHMLYTPLQEMPFDMTKTNNFIFKSMYTIFDVYFSTKLELKKQNKIITNAIAPLWKPRYSGAASDLGTYVVVIGESARRDAHHAYGFNIENTPFLSHTPRIQFNNYISAASLTQSSLLNTFVYRYSDGISGIGSNIINLSNLAGFETYWLSNQFEEGQHDSVISAIARQSKNTVFLNYTWDSLNPARVDKDLIPYIKNAINGEKMRKVIFVHLYGSHAPFCLRTRDYYDVHFRNKNLSCYVYSIKQTDELLKDIYSMLQERRKETGEKWGMIYFSDHGLNEAPHENIFHSSALKKYYHTNFDVPFFILSHDLIDVKYINSQRSAFGFLNFFAKWIGIEDKKLPYQCNFIEEIPCSNMNIVMDNNGKKMNYRNLKKEEYMYFSNPHQ